MECDTESACVPASAPLGSSWTAGSSRSAAQQRRRSSRLAASTRHGQQQTSRHTQILSPAQKCHPHHLSLALSFLLLPDFLNALRVCRSWREARTLQTAWPQPPNIDDLARTMFLDRQSIDELVGDVLPIEVLPGVRSLKFDGVHVLQRGRILDSLASDPLWQHTSLLSLLVPRSFIGFDDIHEVDPYNDMNIGNSSDDADEDDEDDEDEDGATAMHTDEEEEGDDPMVIIADPSPDAPEVMDHFDLFTDESYWVDLSDNRTLRSIETLGALGHLTALEIGVANPSRDALQSCFTSLASTGQLRVLLTHCTAILSQANQLAPSLQGLAVVLSASRERPRVARAVLHRFCRQLVDFHALRFLLLIVGTHEVLFEVRHMRAIRELSVNGQLRHIAIDVQLSFLALRALIQDPDLPTSQHRSFTADVAALKAIPDSLPASRLETVDLRRGAISRSSHLSVLCQPSLRAFITTHLLDGWFPQEVEPRKDEHDVMPASDASWGGWRLTLGEVGMLQRAFFDYQSDGAPPPAEADARLRRMAERRAKAIEGLARLEVLEADFSVAEKAVGVLEHCTALTRLTLQHKARENFAFLDAPLLSRLATAMSRLRDLRLHSCELTADAWSHLGEMRDLEVLEVDESCRLRARQLRPLASLPHFRRLTLCIGPSAELRLTPRIVGLILSSPSWIALVIHRAARLPLPNEADLDEWSRRALPADVLHTHRHPHDPRRRRQLRVSLGQQVEGDFLRGPKFLSRHFTMRPAASSQHEPHDSSLYAYEWRRVE